MTAPVLIACSHGTAVGRGRSTVAQLVRAVGVLRPELDIRHAFVDVQKPRVGDVVAELAAQKRTSVIVPLLLATGFHLSIDIGWAALSSDGWAVVGEPLGAGAALAPAVLDRVDEAGVSDDAALVVIAAGSNDRATIRDLEAVVHRIGDLRSDQRLSYGYVSSPNGSVPTALQNVEMFRSYGFREIAIASYLLAPGVFHTRLREVGADIVTEPLGLHPLVIQRVLDSYDAAKLTLTRGS